MKISDRTLGYLTIIALLFVFAFVALSMMEAHQKSTMTIQVDFDELGSLQPEDLVVVRGFTVGAVGKVEWLGDRARIQIKFDDPIVLREGTRIVNVNYAIMGQRRVEIFPSKTGAIYKDDYIFKGEFEPGIAEILRYIEDVNDQLTVVRDMIHLITEGDSTHPSAKQAFESVVGTVEGTLENADKLMSSLPNALNGLFKQVNSASAELINVTQQADTAVRTVTAAVNEKLIETDKALKSISDGANRANEIISSVEQDSTIHSLLYSRDMVDKVNELIEKINQFVTAIDLKNLNFEDENGNKVQLITWKHINLIGKTAREKAKERAEKGESLPK